MEAEVVLLEEQSFHFYFLINLFCNKKSCMISILKKHMGVSKFLPATNTAM